ncbi:MAG: HYR domain-containing protein [Armatimonadota bacterium]
MLGSASASLPSASPLSTAPGAGPPPSGSRGRLRLGVLTAAGLGALLLAAAGRGGRELPVPAPTAAAQLARLPLAFEPAAPGAPYRFVSRRGGAALYVAPTEAVLALPGRGEAAAGPEVLRMRLLGANPRPVARGLEPLPGRSNYLLGSDPGRWRRDVPHFARVLLRQVYPGIDLLHYGNGRELEHDFVVHPGADPDRIRLAYAGAEAVRIDAAGELVLRLRDGEVRQRRPLIYQEVDGRRVPVDGSYALDPRDTARPGARPEGVQVAFRVAEYDRARPLVIDPVLELSTYLDGSSDDHAGGIAVDAAGNSYVTGITFSSDFPLAGALSGTAGGAGEAFVTKLNPAGSALVYSTYLGGGGLDQAVGIAVDSSGSAYVVGNTRSANFPVTGNALKPTAGAGGEAFVTRLAPSGNALLYSTYLGGSTPVSPAAPADDYGAAIAVDDSGHAYVTGATTSADFPTGANPFQASLAGEQDGYVAKLDTQQSGASSLVFSTYLGGSWIDYGVGIAVRPGTGTVYVAGATESDDFPVSSAAFQATKPEPFFADAFVAQLDAAGSALVYSTFLGGDFEDRARGLAVDGDGNACVTGETWSDNFPVANAAQSGYGGGIDAFATKLDSTGSALVYSTYLGGDNTDFGNGIAVDGDGRVYVTGGTSSSGFPVVDPLQGSHAGAGYDGFVAEIPASGGALSFSTFLGGSDYDIGHSIAVSGSRCVQIAGSTASADFPVAGNPPFQTSNLGLSGFVSRLCLTEPLFLDCPPSVTAENDPHLCSAALTVTTPRSNGVVQGTRSDGKPLTDPYPVGTTVVTWTATSRQGETVTCRQTITVLDTEKPVLTVPANVTKRAKPKACSARVEVAPARATDNCPGVSVACVRSDGKPLTDPYPAGVTTVTCTATDASGNTATGSFTVTVTETVPPMLTVPRDITRPTDRDRCTAEVEVGTPTAKDNCPGVTVTCVRSDGKPLTDPYPVGVTTITCTAVDASGNTTSASYRVRVRDTQKPTCGVPENITRPADPNACTARVEIRHPQAADNCPGVKEECVRSDREPLTAPYPVGKTTITCTCTDASGNTATVTFTVTITDTQKPTCTVPGDLVRPADKGLCSAKVKLPHPRATDNCPGVKESCTRSDRRSLSAPFPVGVTTVTCTCTDRAGNTATASFTVTVQDTQKPTLTAPGSLVVRRKPVQVTVVVRLPRPRVKDNCPGVTVSCVRSDGKPLGDPFAAGVTTITCTATDASGNTASASYTVTVR